MKPPARTASRRCTGTETFGCFDNELKAWVSSYTTTYDLASIAQSVLSDAQELQNLSNHEAARQHINRAKFILQRIKDQTR